MSRGPHRISRRGTVYRFLFRTVLSRLDAEAAHRLAFAMLRILTAVPGVARLLRRSLAPRDPAIRVSAFGLDFPSPLGLAAGFDKNAEGPDALGSLGFGFVEVGTVTAHPQPGNPRPRLFRLPRDRALINRMGFNNHGAAAATAHLRRRPRRTVVGVNIGKTKTVAESDAVTDYITSARHVASVADYVVVNVSSPNTPGLRNLQAVEHLRPLLRAVREALDQASPRRIPLLVKIAPDLANDDIDAIASLALELGLDGIIATNTTVSRPVLASDPAEVDAAGPGGLSGAPLKPRALGVLARLRARVGDRIVLVAAGGIETADDAWERVIAGATLVQAYTGFIYGGPLWPHRLQRDLAARLHHEGFTTLSDAIGSAAPAH